MNSNAKTWREAAEIVRNWGRWGAEDELGTLNYIDASTVVAAARLVQRGAIFPLGNAFNEQGPQRGDAIRRNPIHVMTLDGGDRSLEGKRVLGSSTSDEIATLWGAGPMRFNDDFIIMPLQACTQWDALAHAYYDELMYNGHPASAVTSLGAAKNGIDKVAAAGGFVARGVLVDVASHRGVANLDPLDVIHPEELDEVLTAAGVAVGRGDVVMVRTGWWNEFERTRDPVWWTNQAPGLSWRCAEWLHGHEVAAVACDNPAVEPAYEVEGVVLPLHMLTLRDMGLMLGEMWNFEALAADCAEDRVYECQLVAQPIKFTGAVGSPLNPIAIK